MNLLSGVKANNHIHLTVKSVTFFADAKKTPLFTASDVGVIEELELRSSSSITPR
jgi:hypothetical protein